MADLVALPPAVAERILHNPLNPELTPARLAEFERTLPGPLPEDFRELLRRYNGARLGECKTGVVNARGEEVTLREFLGVHDEGWSKLEYPQENIPEGFLEFAPAGVSDVFGLQLVDRADSPRGAVWFFDAHAESDTEDLYVARKWTASFAEFLAKLEPLPDESVDPLPPDPDSPWNNPEKLRKVPPDPATRERPLVLAGHAKAIEQARMGIAVTAWHYDDVVGHSTYDVRRADARYWLEIRVDESSGEDGAAAPEAQVIPVVSGKRTQHPTLAEWATLVVSPSNAWEAWYGNDAPHLEQNELRVLGPVGKEVPLRWTAQYSEYGATFDFLFEGTVAFDGIRFAVRNESDVNAVLDSAFGGALDLREWEVQIGQRVDAGEGVRAEERFGYPVRLLPRAGGPDAEARTTRRSKRSSAPEPKRSSAAKTNRSSAPKTKRPPAPKTNRSPSPKTKRSPSPKTKRSPSPKAKRSPSPKMKRSPSPKTKRSPSPKTKRSPSPKTKRSPSPKTKRSPSLKTKRSPSPKTKRSPSPKTKRSPSPKTKRSKTKRSRAPRRGARREK